MGAFYLIVKSDRNFLCSSLMSEENEKNERTHVDKSAIKLKIVRLIKRLINRLKMKPKKVFFNYTNK